MSKRDIGLYIVDIFIAISKLERYTLNFDDAQELLHDEVYWDAVIRELQIIGEATNKLIQLHIVSDEYRDIVDFRNIIIHAYFGINAEIVWDIIKNHLSLYTKELFQVVKDNSLNLYKAIESSQLEQKKIKNVKVYKYLENLKDEIDTL